MGKKQHQKDKLYLTTTEWKNEFGGFKGKQKTEFRRLPFYCCSLSMQPFENPLCTMEGIIFDLMNIVPFLKKYGINPATGEKMTAKDLVRLNFHKNAEGKYHCPVTFKVFNENTQIVAIKPTGNVFANEAIERLNIKPSFWKDLLTDEPFTRKDIITIQDPTNLEKFNISTFYHLKKNLKLLDDDDAKKDPKYNLKMINAETRDVLETLEKEYKAPYEKLPSVLAYKSGPTANTNTLICHRIMYQQIREKKEEEKKPKLDIFSAAHYSTGMVAASFTSTAMDVMTEHEAAVIDEDIIRYARVKKKGYVRIITNFGPLNVELHCEMVPKTCENFIKHCVNGYYRGTIFHRLIRNFVLQGGDPTGTGTGGESIWGGSFKDELKPNLIHTGRGILSMANSGPNTNKSQFFFTLRSANHLNGKHTVFGRIVGGVDTLDKIEKVETDKNDRPLEEIKIEESTVFVNPYDEVDEELRKEREEELSRQAKEAADKKKAGKKKDVDDKLKTFKQGVGKYINPSTMKRNAESSADHPSEIAKKRSKTTKGTFGDFSSW